MYVASYVAGTTCRWRFLTKGVNQVAAQLFYTFKCRSLLASASSLLDTSLLFFQLFFSEFSIENEERHKSRSVGLRWLGLCHKAFGTATT